MFMMTSVCRHAVGRVIGVRGDPRFVSVAGGVMATVGSALLVREATMVERGGRTKVGKITSREEYSS